MAIGSIALSITCTDVRYLMEECLSVRPLVLHGHYFKHHFLPLTLLKEALCGAIVLS